ncbi:hypothetical protein MMC22_002909 [Lobaria immixta]|nr:hypothetical protein [Lobaria immixta]
MPARFFEHVIDRGIESNITPEKLQVRHTRAETYRASASGRGAMATRRKALDQAEAECPSNQTKAQEAHKARRRYLKLDALIYRAQGKAENNLRAIE